MVHHEEGCFAITHGTPRGRTGCWVVSQWWKGFSEKKSPTFLYQIETSPKKRVILTISATVTTRSIVR
ncbi:hypothetical protein CDAR_410691 [Caerostris darwini]|uniref:Uncharacterized protein n=1 Tax=Caerostris darwini TaxID=1538125 RepID=A0AAV4P7K5_9ARAC|nr:hypothetical protein CDAR_410691 [Caerostris darwini]